jgi:hypothetical protein
MASYRYTVMPRDETYTVHRDGLDVGMVWRAGDIWHADHFGMHAPEISEPTRDAAAAKLPDAPFQVRAPLPSW